MNKANNMSQPAIFIFTLILISISAQADDCIRKTFPLPEAARGQIRVNAQIRPVLVFGKDKALYISDAETEKPIVTVTHQDFKYSLPSEIKLLDLNRDGMTDRLYFGDLGGQVFRVDIDPSGLDTSDLSSQSLQVFKLADLGKENHFYAAPSVALLVVNSQFVIGVAIGASDFFMLFDEPDEPPKKPTVYNDLIEKEKEKGWVFKLNQTGEKVLTSPLIFKNHVIFSSYIPKQSCDYTTRLYVLSAYTGEQLRVFKNKVGYIENFTDHALVSVEIRLNADHQAVLTAGGKIFHLGEDIKIDAPKRWIRTQGWRRL